MFFEKWSQQEGAMSHFGELLRVERKRARLTQQELAAKAGIDHSYISKMETEGETLPTRDIALKLAEVLGIRKKSMRWFDFLLAAGVASAEDMEGFTLQVISKPMPTAAYPAMAIPDSLGTTGEEIENLIASAKLSDEEEEKVATALVEITKQLLSLIKTERKMP